VEMWTGAYNVPGSRSGSSLEDKSIDRKFALHTNKWTEEEQKLLYCGCFRGQVWLTNYSPCDMTSVDIAGDELKLMLNSHLYLSNRRPKFSTTKRYGQMFSNTGFESRHGNLLFQLRFFVVFLLLQLTSTSLPIHQSEIIFDAT